MWLRVGQKLEAVVELDKVFSCFYKLQRTRLEQNSLCTGLSRWGWLQVGQKLEAVVELDKDDYLVLSFPERAGIVGFAATSDLNLQGQRSFSLGQKLQATVAALPAAGTGAASSSPRSSGRQMCQYK